jgi:hypothetical protein
VGDAGAIACFAQPAAVAGFLGELAGAAFESSVPRGYGGSELRAALRVLRAVITFSTIRNAL